MPAARQFSQPSVGEICGDSASQGRPIGMKAAGLAQPCRGGLRRMAGPMAGNRKGIPAGTEAALWALSNGRCYAPGCTAPVVVEVRPGVYRKNAQMAHIRGVRAPRYDPALSATACASFSNLLILCLPHHGEVDDRKTGETLYPVETLTLWKSGHEGANGPALAALGPIDEETLTRLLTQVFSPPAGDCSRSRINSRRPAHSPRRTSSNSGRSSRS